MSAPDARVAQARVLQRWAGSVSVFALGVGFAMVFFLAGSPAAAAVTALVAAAVSWWNSPARSGTHLPLSEVPLAAGRSVVVLWRPGCPTSAELRRRLRRDGVRVHWVNIWRDPDGATLCRSLNHGTEQVPTVCVLDSAHTAPVVIPATTEGVQEAAASLVSRRRAA